jgi:CheY-like chemotaxis protein
MRARATRQRGYDSGAGGIGRAVRPDIVLIVDDDAAFRDAVAELVSDEGLAVATAINGQQALEMLASGLRPIAILLDMMMPVMDGPAFRAAQLAMADARSIPVAVMSASGTSRQEINTIFGDVEYIPKPTSGAAIVSFLARCRLASAPTRAAR